MRNGEKAGCRLPGPLRHDESGGAKNEVLTGRGLEPIFTAVTVPVFYEITNGKAQFYPIREESGMRKTSQRPVSTGAAKRERIF
jgi:hypothetical protein